MKKKITEILFNTLDGNLNKEQIFQLIEIPPDEKFADFALPCFSLAKSYRRNPQEIAAKLADSIVKRREIHKAQAVSGYLNLFVDRQQKIFIKKYRTHHKSLQRTVTRVHSTNATCTQLPVAEFKR